MRVDNPTITKIANLTTNGLVVTSGGDGTLGIETSTYIREKLTADRTYYVRTDGNDSNDGLTNVAGGAKLTIQGAITAINLLDMNSKAVTVQVADGTYTGGVSVGGMQGYGLGSLTIQGNAVTPTNVIISTTSVTAFNCRGNVANPIVIKNMKITTATSGHCIQAQAGVTVQISGIDFGACASYHMDASHQGRITVVGNYTISGGALAHCVAEYFGWFQKSTAYTVTISNTPAFSSWYALAYCGYLHDMGGTFSGSATGTRYSAQQNGIINTNGGGANYFPGNSAGSTATGGQYV